MKFLSLLSLLVIPGLSNTGISSESITCSDGLASGALRDTDNTCCYATCTRDATTAVCVSDADIKTAVSNANTDVLTAYKKACSLSGCSAAELTWNDARTSCECPTCDQTSRCDAYNADPGYICKEGKCRQKRCVTVADGDNNFVSYEVTDDLTLADDKSLCSEYCTSRTTETPATTKGSDTDVTKTTSTSVTRDADATTTGTDATKTTSGTSCTEGRFDDNGCYKPCLSGTLRDSRDLSGIYSDKEAFLGYIEKCKERNAALADCEASEILPNYDSDSTLASRDSICVCGRCVQTCEYEKRFIRYKNDAGEIKCKRMTCTTTKSTTTTSATSLLGTRDSKESYINQIRTVTTDIVEMTYCDNDGDDDTTTTTEEPSIDDYCKSPCEDGDEPFCVYDTKLSVQTTFRCAGTFKCKVREAGSIDRYRIDRYGRCPEATANECEVGDYKVSDERSSRAPCSKHCTCIANPRGDSYGNVWRCDTMERNWENLKKKCSSTLDTDCPYENLYFVECPPSGSDPCDYLYCKTDEDPTVCRVSSEGFTTDITKRGDGECYYNECDADTGDLVARAYTKDTTTSAGIIRRCPRIADCPALAYETKGFCGICPICPVTADDKRCSLRTLRDDCDEDPDEDTTRDKPDGTRADFVGKIRIKMAIRFCAKEFFARDRSEIYVLIKEAAYAVAGECDDIDLDDLSSLRAYIEEFNYEFTAKESTDECDSNVLVTFKVGLYDITLVQLRKIASCLIELRDNDSVDIRAKIATKLGANLAHSRIKEGTTDETDDTTTYVQTSTASSATVEFSDSDDNDLLTVTTTTSGGDYSDNNSNSNQYTIFGVIAALFMSVLF